MFIPIGDDNSDRKRTPWVNYALIAANVLVFVLFQGLGNDLGFTYAYACVPNEILTGADIVTGAMLQTDPITGHTLEQPGLGVTPIPVYGTLLTSMFMHGSLAHLGGNMLYLWICGDNLENAMGHVKYLLFYLLCGVLAGLSHVFTTAFLGQSGLIPCLGASGAISGVLGGYMLLFPRRRIHMFAYITTLSVPAIVAVGLWFVFQIVNGAGALTSKEGGGIAYAAHIGGFLAGLLLVKLFAAGGRMSETEMPVAGWRSRNDW